MKVILMGHTQLAEGFLNRLIGEIGWEKVATMEGATAGAVIALSAIRTCYSPLKPSEVIAAEGDKYFGREATDGEGGSEADRLIRHIVKSKHTSTLEHISFVFSVERLTRAALAQLTRHRTGTGYSVQSQRYVRFGSKDKSGGFEYTIPDTVLKKGIEAVSVFEQVMDELQESYDNLRKLGVPAEDARAVLPQASHCNLTFSINLRAALELHAKRKKGNGAQGEIAEFVDRIKDEIIAVEPWTAGLFQ